MAFLEESEISFRLERGDFVFLGHQGYEFLFFNVADSSDPPVFLLVEDAEPIRVSSHFSEWLLSCIGDQAGG